MGGALGSLIFDFPLIFTLYHFFLGFLPESGFYSCGILFIRLYGKSFRIGARWFCHLRSVISGRRVAAHVCTGTRFLKPLSLSLHPIHEVPPKESTPLGTVHSAARNVHTAPT